MGRRILSTPDTQQAFAIGVLTGVLVGLAVVSIAFLLYSALLFVIRKINLVAMGINETEFGTIHAAILKCRREQQACLPKEGKRTRWFKGMTLRALNGISHDEFVFLESRPKKEMTASRRKAISGPWHAASIPSSKRSRVGANVIGKAHVQTIKP